MCTVTYIPRPDGSIVLSSNRDVPAKRSPDHLSKVSLGDLDVCYPKDKLAGGTWMAADSAGKYGCLLNGAFEKHRHNPPYKMSRGQMVMDYFRYKDVNAFKSGFDFTGMEPFTFIVFDGNTLTELRWDEKELYSQALDQKTAHIWSSSTLYTPAMRTLRKRWLTDFIKKGDRSLKAIQDFHRTTKLDDPENDIIMKRGNMVETVSISHLSVQARAIDFFYEDLVSGKKDQCSLEINN